MYRSAPELYVRHCSACQVWADSESFDDDMHCPQEHRMDLVEVVPRPDVDALVEQLRPMYQTGLNTGNWYGLRNLIDQLEALSPPPPEGEA